MSEESSLASSRIGDYLKALSSSAATPGGGAAAALAAAQAASLLRMVCELSQGRRFVAVAEEIAAIEREAAHAVVRLMNLCDADVVAFEQYMAVRRLPRATEAERAARESAMETALKAAADVPLRMLDTAVALLPLAERLAAIGNPNLITDVGVAVRLAEAAAHSARLNVLINTKSIRDAEFVAASNRSTDAALETARGLLARTLDAVERVLHGA
jgi:methenyltetrahydrofolate cyclohydrolase